MTTYPLANGPDDQPAGSADTPRTAQPSSDWGRLGEFSLLAAIGLFVIALAYNRARMVQPGAAALRWLGVFLICAPLSFRLFSSTAPRRERIGLVLVAGLSIYLLRLLYSPLEFQFADELQHWRTMRDIIETGHLYKLNHILPISPYYPGLESATSAVIDLTGLDIFAGSVAVMASARVLFVLALYLFYERASGSSRIAGIASLLYMTNPHYQSFAAMFIYQSLALPLTALALMGLAHLRSAAHGSRTALRLALLTILVAVIVTHHLTSYIALVFLALWALTSLFFSEITGVIDKLLLAVNRVRLIGPLIHRFLPWDEDQHQAERQSRDASLLWSTLLAFTVILSWIAYIAPLTARYLGDPMSEAGMELIRMITADASVDQIYSAPSGPAWERLISFASVGIVSLWLLLGIWRLWRRGHNNDPLAIALGIGALGYHGSIALRLTSSGAEFTARAWPFLFLAVAIGLAVGANDTAASLRREWMCKWLFPALTVILFAASVTAGWPPAWGRLPGPFLVSASERSIGPEGVEAARWAGSTLSPSNRLATNFTNHILMGAYGGQDPVFGLGAVFFAPEYGADEQEALRYMDVHYLVVDLRLAGSLPLRGVYFDPTEPGANQHVAPMDLAALDKFDGLPQVDRLFDSGNIAVYEVDSTW